VVVRGQRFTIQYPKLENNTNTTIKEVGTHQLNKDSGNFWFKLRHHNYTNVIKYCTIKSILLTQKGCFSCIDVVFDCNLFCLCYDDDIVILLSIMLLYFLYFMWLSVLIFWLCCLYFYRSSYKCFRVQLISVFDNTVARAIVNDVSLTEAEGGKAISEGSYNVLKPL
jgi:hypothetical protein